MSKETDNSRKNSNTRFWMRLDNAALIFPASLRKNWSNAFRISFSFNDPVDPAVLQQALDQVVPRFPSICVRLRKSFFWYYLEEAEVPTVKEDSYQPLIGMNRKDISRCAIRVLYYRNRMAVEYFHSVTDGTGGMVFAKNLAAEYVRLYYGVDVPCEGDIKDLTEPVPPEEMEDSFQEHAGPVAAPRDDHHVFHLTGEKEPDHFLHVTCGILEGDQLKAKAKEKGVTITGYLSAILLKCILDIQYERLGIEHPEEPWTKHIHFRELRRRNKLEPVKVQIPVNLRKLYGTKTMRNFVAVVNIGVDPRMGYYTLDELFTIVHHQMQLEITEKNMRAIFTPNVNSEQNPVTKVMPLFIKNLVMRAVFDAIGESVACICLSNLGMVSLPKAMEPYVSRVEFVLGSQSQTPYNCSVTSWKGKTYIEMVRNSIRPELEKRFFRLMVQEGLHVKIENNDRKQESR
ncbi:MAG: hypothetical protein J6P72_02465 [Firmicutes bacterium]|nr:hypothetical protein [Bacillota bacterium]